MIYFAQAVDGGPVKIGHSSDVDIRLKALESYYGKPLVLLATMPGGVTAEREIHARFAHLRLKTPRGRDVEQFRPAPDLMEFIDRPLLAGANPEAVEMMKGCDGVSVINLKGSDDQREWMARATRKTHIPAATIARLALDMWGKANGIGPFPGVETEE